jgi:TonB family protein
MELDPLTVLKNQYTIKETLGDPGPFDIRYAGEDVESGAPYVIREFFPVDFVTRDAGKTSISIQGGDNESAAFQSGLEYFQRESEVLADLDDEVIPDGYTFFEANGTAYRARPQESGMALAQGLESQGAISEKAALSIMVPILDGLQAAHDDGLYHGGVSPRTIRLLEEGSVLLTGFRGAFIQFARQRGQLSKLVHPGTSAIEQYTPRGNQGPWTDVYAAAATITQMVTGQALPEASDRLEGDDPVMAMIQDADAFSSPGVREALIDALTVDPSKRLQAADALSGALRESSERYDGSGEAYSILPVESSSEDGAGDEPGDDVEVLSTAEGRPPRSSPADRSADGQGSSSRLALLVGVPLLVLALGGGAWFVMSSGGASAGGGAGATYADYRSRADSLYEQREYQQARRVYQRALQEREGDPYVQQRLAAIEDEMQASSSRQYQQAMARGDSLKNRADSLFANGSTGEANTIYSQAMAAYFSALDARSGDDQANERIDQIERRQQTIAEQQVGSDGGDIDVQSIANFFKKQAQTQLERDNLQAALRKYRQAAEYSPDDRQLQQVIADLEQDIRRQKRQDEYLDAMRRGKQAMRQQNYTEARDAFQAAVNIWSSDNAEEALAEAKNQLQERTQRQEEYRTYRSQADEAYQQGNYQEAIRGYKQALEVRPGDGYAEGQLEKAQEELEELQLAKAKQSQAQERQEKMVGPDGVYKVVDKEPSVKGGLGALHENVRYPERAARRGIEGRVYVQAVVNADGTVRSASVARGIGGGCDDEALRVVRDTEFNPAKVEGKAVPARTTVWIQFSL